MNVRAFAVVGALVAGLSTAYIVGQLLGMPDPDWAYLPRGLIHLGELAIFVALGLSGAAGPGLRAGAAPRLPRPSSTTDG